MIRLIFITMLVSCGAPEVISDAPPEPRERYVRMLVDGELMDDTTMYLKESRAYGLHQWYHVNEVRVKDPKTEEYPNAIGMCIREDDVRTIFVAPQDNRIGPWIQKSILYHELAHCVHGLEHKKESPIMRRYQIMSEQFIEDNWDFMKSELFLQIYRKQN